MKPLAPGFESTTTGWPHVFASLSAIIREKTAGAAPAEYGAVSLTSFDGNVCAPAESAVNADHPTTALMTNNRRAAAPSPVVNLAAHISNLPSRRSPAPDAHCAARAVA